MFCLIKKQLQKCFHIMNQMHPKQSGVPGLYYTKYKQKSMSYIQKLFPK